MTKQWKKQRKKDRLKIRKIGKAGFQNLGQEALGVLSSGQRSTSTVEKN